MMTPQYVYTDSPRPLIPSRYDVPLFSNQNFGTPIAVTLLPQRRFELPPSYDLNKYEAVRHKEASYFRYKILDKWIYEDMSNLLGYLEGNRDNIHLISDLSKYNKNAVVHDSEDVIEAKIQHLEDNIITKKVVYRILKNFVDGTKANWYELHKNEYFVKEALSNGLNEIITERIKEKKIKEIK